MPTTAFSTWLGTSIVIIAFKVITASHLIHPVVHYNFSFFTLFHFLLSYCCLFQTLKFNWVATIWGIRRRRKQWNELWWKIPMTDIMYVYFVAWSLIPNCCCCCLPAITFDLPWILRLCVRLKWVSRWFRCQKHIYKDKQSDQYLGRELLQSTQWKGY